MSEPTRESDEPFRDLDDELDLHNPAVMNNRVPQRQAAVIERLTLTTQHEL